MFPPTTPMMERIRFQAENAQLTNEAARRLFTPRPTIFRRLTGRIVNLRWRGQLRLPAVFPPVEQETCR